MLAELGCQFVLVGHSEPRGRFGVPEPDFDDMERVYVSVRQPGARQAEVAGRLPESSFVPRQCHRACDRR